MNEHHWYQFESWWLDYNELNTHLEQYVLDDNPLYVALTIRQIKEHLKKLQVLFGEYIEKTCKGEY